MKKRTRKKSIRSWIASILIFSFIFYLFFLTYKVGLHERTLEALTESLYATIAVIVSGASLFLVLAPGLLFIFYEFLKEVVLFVGRDMSRFIVYIRSRVSMVVSFIKAPPARRTTKFFSFILHEKEKIKIYDPIYADFMHEYYKALEKGQKWKSRWLRFRFYIDVGKAFGLQTLASLVWDVIDIVRKPADGAS